MKTLFLLCGLGIASAGFGQAYYPFKKQEINYFVDTANTTVFPLKVDSVKVQGQDSVYYLFKQVRSSQHVQSCQYTAHGASWLGETVRVTPQGEVVFTNREQREFVLQTKAALGASWIAYTSPQWKAKVTYTGVSKEVVWNVEDSVKRFTVQIVDDQSMAVVHPYNGFELKLSKHHGLVQLVNFYTWHTSADYLEPTVLQVHLAGSDHTTGGVVNLTGKQLFHFDIGDVFHRVLTYTNHMDVQEQIDRIDTILDKKVTDSSYVYTIRRTEKKNRNEVITYTSTTEQETYRFSDLSPLPRTLHGGAVNDMLYNRDVQRWGKKQMNLFVVQSDTCLGLPLAGVCFPYYVEGLGEFSYECINHGLNPSWTRQLVYFKKGQEEYGAPLVTGHKEDMTWASQVKAHPNPAKDMVHFSFGTLAGEVQLELRDMTGQVVASKKAQGACELSLSAFPKGLYFYTVTHAARQASGKLVVE